MKQKRHLLIPNINFTILLGHGGQERRGHSKLAVQETGNSPRPKMACSNSNWNICKFPSETKRSRKNKSLALSSSIVTVQMHVEMGTRGGGETWGNADGAFDCIMCALHGKFPFCFHRKSARTTREKLSYKMPPTYAYTK